MSSPRVESNQDGVHPDLEWTVRRHLEHTHRRPFAEHTVHAFAQVQEWLSRHPGPLVLDSGCGVGESSRRLAMRLPDHSVIGIDKSELRLEKGAKDERLAAPENLLLVRADLVDFWELAKAAGWTLARHYVLYPNPWPKSSHLFRRWHGHPVFPAILALGGVLELRTNWKVYAEEFSLAIGIATGRAPAVEPLASLDDLTPFERKYRASGHDLWTLQIAL